MQASTNKKNKLYQHYEINKIYYRYIQIIYYINLNKTAQKTNFNQTPTDNLSPHKSIASTRKKSKINKKLFL